MTLLETVAPASIVAALFVLAWPFLPKNKLWPRYLILGSCGLIAIRYLPWRFNKTVLPVDIYSIEGLWIWFVFIVEMIYLADLFRILFLHSTLLDRRKEIDAAESLLQSRDKRTWPIVDVFIPTYNEPLDVLERSIVGALNLDYPHFSVWVLDDGDREWLEKYCREKGAKYINRTEHRDAKAGNINNALMQSEADFIAVFDADFVPYRNFLTRLMGLFDDPKIGIIQTPQHFFNRDPIQRNLWMADRWPDEQRMFFDNLAPALDAQDSMFCCGSCSVLRRTAIDAIGGIPTESITEDILTSLTMLRKGFITRFINERLSIGLAPETLEAFYVQRQRWCQGGIQTLFLKNGVLGPDLDIVRRILLFPLFWVFHVPARFILFLIPILYLWLDLPPMFDVRDSEIIFWQMPLLVVSWCAMYWLFGRQAVPIMNDGPATLVSIRLFPVVISSFIRPFGKPFKVTPKGSMTIMQRVSLYDLSIIAVFFILTFFGVIINAGSDTRIVEAGNLLGMAYFWCAINMVTLALAALVCFENPIRRVQERFPVVLTGIIVLSSGTKAECVITDLSLNGANWVNNTDQQFQKNATGMLELNGFPPLPGIITRLDGDDVGFAFVDLPSGTRDFMIRLLYTSGIDNAAQAGELDDIAIGIARRFLGEAEEEAQ